MPLNKNQKQKLRTLESIENPSQAQLGEIAALKAKAAAPRANANRTQVVVKQKVQRQRNRNTGGNLAGTVSALNRLALRQLGPRLSEAEYKSILTQPGAHAKTAAGAGAFVAANHPWDPPASFLGWPDSSTGRVSVPHYKTYTDIIYDPSMFDTVPTNVNLGDIHIILVPSPEIAYMYYFVVNGVRSNIRVVRQETFTAQITGQTGNFPIFLADNGASKHRIPSEGLTVIFDAPALVDGGTVYAGQFLPEVIDSELTVISPSTNETKSGRLMSFIIPGSSQSLARIDSGMYEERAKNGVAMPLKMAMQGNSFPYVDAATGQFVTVPTLPSTKDGWVRDMTWQIQTTDDAVIDASPPMGFTAESRIAIPLGVPATAATPYGTSFGIYTPGASEPSQTNWGLIIFRGVQLQVATGGAVVLRIKQVTNPDLFVYGPTAISPYAKESPLLDTLAVDSTLMMQQMMPSAYPASANGFLDFLKNAVGWAANKGSGFVKSLVNMIPVIGPLASEVTGTVLGAADTLLNTDAAMG